jgi:two-component system chemotaxis response regulator CheY
MDTERRRSAKVLVVEDFPTMRKILRNLLKSLGFEHVVEARNAHEAMCKLQHDTYDIIFSDWNMPSMSGEELLEFVRDDDRCRDIPFVMITMQADRESVIKARELGVSQYLTKPFTAEELEKKVAEVLK